LREPAYPGISRSGWGAMKRKLLRLLDRSLGPLAVSLLIAWERIRRLPSRVRPATTGVARGSRQGPVPGRILVIKIVGLGDTVLMLTPIASLRRRFPHASISVLVTPLSCGIVANQPSIDEVIVYDVLRSPGGIRGFMRLVRLLRAKHFDCIIDCEQYFQMTAVVTYLTGAPRRIGFCFNDSLRGKLYTDAVSIDPQCHMVDSYMRLLEPLGIDSGRIEALEQVHIDSQDRVKVGAWLAGRGIGNGDIVVGIHAGSGSRAPYKRWDEESFAEIVGRLGRRLGAQVILTGTVSERQMIDRIMSLSGNRTAHNSGGEFETKQAAVLIERCDLFISNDTGPMHIAAAVGTPTIGLFGPESPSRYAPVGKRNVALYKRTRCSPCVEIYRGKVRDCDDPICMRDISVEDVWTEILRYDLKRNHI